MHLLIVEDDLDLGRALQSALTHHGFSSEWVRDARSARAHVGAAGIAVFACIVLDLGLPDGQGTDLIRAWRGQGISLPIIILTARDALDSRIEGLDSGADDYVIKPVAPEELASRIHAVARRASGHTSAVWNLGGLCIDTRNHAVHLHGAPVALSPKEFLFVVELARQAGCVVPRHRIAQMLNPLGEPLEFNALDWHIHNLRRKLGAQRIQTVRGVGYRLGEA
jgi:two-component system response regulator QseB